MARLVAGPRGGEALGGDPHVVGPGLDVPDALGGRGPEAEGCSFVADPFGRRALGVAAAEDRVLAVEGLDVLVDLAGRGREAEGDDVEGHDPGEADAQEADPGA